MAFTSLSYLILLFAVLAVVSPWHEESRWFVLLFESYAFYLALQVPYLPVILLAITAITFLTGRCLGKCQEDGKRAAIFWSGFSANILTLVALKGWPYLRRYLPLAADYTRPSGELLVTIGVSYFIFQAVSYLIDVYWEIEEPEGHFGYFALYLAFFPKLLQGPIERAGDLLPQLRARQGFDYDNVRAGLVLFAWGMLKKVVLADRLAFFVNTVYDDVHAHTGLDLLFATYVYAVQLYCDFSGYTDMALGSALVFNIRLTQNFNTPYLASSIADFWRRWHISFSRWILDYIFKPLQMQFRRWQQWGSAGALLVTFLVSGVWHGANGHFVVWGALHGFYLAIAVLCQPLRKKICRRLGRTDLSLPKFWQTVVTFQLVCFAWIFFRARNLGDATYVVSHLFAGLTRPSLDAVRYGLLAAGSLALTASVETLHRNRQVMAAVLRRTALRWTAYYTLALAIAVFGVFGGSQFMYFKF